MQTVTRERRDLHDKPITNTTLVRVPLTSTTKSDNSTNSAQPVVLTPNTKSTPQTSVNVENPKLLGVNGTGQRKDITSTKPTIVSEPISTDASKPTVTVNNIKNTKNEYTTPKSIDDELHDSIISEIDKPFENINQTLKDHLQNTTFKEETYQYYNSTTIVNKEKSLEYWSNMKNFTVSSLLSKSHRRAIVNNSIN